MTNQLTPSALMAKADRAEEIRLVADYKGDSVEFDDAKEMVAQAETFVTAMRAEFMQDDSNVGDYGMVP